jgi:hypothetical protein
MTRSFAFCLVLVLAPAIGWAEEPSKEGDKLVSGMSIVGNDEAPKSLAIVPWKGSDLGDTLDLLKSLDDGRQPVDRDVFMRKLDYYEIRAESHEAAGPGPQ